MNAFFEKIRKNKKIIAKGGLFTGLIVGSAVASTLKFMGSKGDKLEKQEENKSVSKSTDNSHVAEIFKHLQEVFANNNEKLNGIRNLYQQKGGRQFIIFSRKVARDDLNLNSARNAIETTSTNLERYLTSVSDQQKIKAYFDNQEFEKVFILINNKYKYFVKEIQGLKKRFKKEGSKRRLSKLKNIAVDFGKLTKESIDLYNKYKG